MAAASTVSAGKQVRYGYQAASLQAACSILAEELVPEVGAPPSRGASHRLGGDGMSDRLAITGNYFGDALTDKSIRAEGH